MSRSKMIGAHVMPLKVMRPRWRKAGGYGRVRQSEIRGLPSQYSDPHAIVDASIAPLIACLNSNGLRTTYCCSGMRVDHDAVRMRIVISGYIAFERPMPKALMALLPRNVVENPYTIRVRGKSERAGVGVDETKWHPVREAITAFIEA